MRGFATEPGVDRVISGIARRQYGVVTHRQLRDRGVGRGQIERRLAQGRLLRLHHAVYLVGHDAPRREARWLGAVLACGDGAVLSHRSAATLWRIRDGEGPRPDVTSCARRRRPGIATHRADLAPDDVTTRQSIPVTSSSRTLIDICLILDDDDAERVVREAQFRRLYDVPALRDALTRRPCPFLERMLLDIAPTQSPLEDLLLRICDGHGIPRPRTQHRLPAGRIDFVWPEQRLVVETDGWDAHSTPSAFQKDRTVSNQLQLDGYLVLRFTRADLLRRPERVAAQILAALAR